MCPGLQYNSIHIFQAILYNTKEKYCKIRMFQVHICYDNTLSFNVLYVLVCFINFV